MREDIEIIEKYKKHEKLFKNQYEKYREQRKNLSNDEVHNNNNI